MRRKRSNLRCAADEAAPLRENHREQQVDQAKARRDHAD